MSFPVSIKGEGFKEPDDPIRFVLAGNGLFLVKEVDLYRACVKVDGVPGLLPHQESLELKFPKLPKALVQTARGFLEAVYARHRGEGILLLFYSPSQGFRLEAPRQWIYRKSTSRASYGVKYENLPAPEGFVKLGSWHSHADAAAFHSREDHHDEIKEDGLHIVTGNLDRASPSFSLSFVVNGHRFFLEKEAVMEEYDRPIPPPSEWLEKVTCVERYRSWRGGYVRWDFGGKH